MMVMGDSGVTVISVSDVELISIGAARHWRNSEVVPNKRPPLYQVVRRHQRRRSHGMPQVRAEETDHPLLRLQSRDVNAELHPVDPFDFQGHMPYENLGYARCYAHQGSVCWHRPEGQLPPCAVHEREGLPPVFESTDGTLHVSSV
jgi:hypothetical protein